VTRVSHSSGLTLPFKGSNWVENFWLIFVLYERLPVWQEIFDINSKGGCSLISGLFVQTRSLLTLMEFAEKALVSVTSFKGPDKHTGLLSRGPTCSAIYLISTCATY
jgi:hypothetical protein